MHRARAFFSVCAGVFLLALSYHLGARSAGAQAPGNPVVGLASDSNHDVLYAATANGDVYILPSPNSASSTWRPWAGVFGGSSPVQRESFGAMKSRYRGERGAARPTPQDR
jgi:hypothetical protein